MSRGPLSPDTVTVPAAVGALAPFVAAGVFGSYEVQLAATVRQLQPGVTDEVILALAMAARAPRFGHVCVGLDTAALQVIESDDDSPGSAALPWPAPDGWAQALEASVTVAGPGGAATEPVRPLVWDGRRLYLQRYWHYELAVADDIVRRSASSPSGGDPSGDNPTVETTLDVVFGPDAGGDDPDLQRRAVSRGLRPGVSIIAGGPGTGKTYTVARLLAAARLVATAEGRESSVALAAPTGKAAARMGEAVRAGVHDLDAAGHIGPGLVEALTAIGPTTVHSLLGRRDRTRFRHDRQHPLPHDLVVVDETSMVSLPLMARLLSAVRPEARLVLVGDPFQLASIEAGTVLSDLVGRAGTLEVPGDGGTGDLDQVVDVGSGADDGASDGRPALAGRVTVLQRMRRFGEDSAIAALAEAVRTGDVDGAMALLARHPDDVRWVDPAQPAELARVSEEVFAGGAEMVSEALAGDPEAALAAAHRIKVLAATRRGPLGVYDWTGRIEAAVAAVVPGYSPSRRWHVGRPVMVTANDSVNQVFNGDVGVVVAGNPGSEVVIGDSGALRSLAPSRLDRVETWWAMTIHKSQGSEFLHAVVSLPDARSPILTRELLYTGVTRARERLTLVGSEASLRAAIARPVTRASGLRDRLWPS